MQYRQLGRSGLLVSDICLGTMIFGEEGHRYTPPEDAWHMLDQYVDAGGNFIDTANVYANGRSEEIIGEWLKTQRRDELVLATKVRFARGDHPNALGLSRFHIMHEVENSLRRLRIDTIDLYYAHMWDSLTPIDETLRAFDDLITQGKVRYIGVSNYKAWQVMKTLATSDALNLNRIIAGQYQYSLITREVEYEYIDLFAAEGVAMVPWGPLAGGFLTGKYQRDEQPASGRIANTPAQDEEAWERRNIERNWTILDAVTEIAAAHDATHTHIALAWLLAQPTVASVIIGPRTPEQLEDNLGASDLVLAGEELAKLDEVSALPDVYPYRMMKLYGAPRI